MSQPTTQPPPDRSDDDAKQRLLRATCGDRARGPALLDERDEKLGTE